MLPIRFIAESFRFEVEWDEETQTITITGQTASAPAETPAPTTEPKAGKTLVVYYSATGNTKNVANYIAAETDADVFELQPVEPYTCLLYTSRCV